jgi:hypothetical protein
MNIVLKFDFTIGASGLRAGVGAASPNRGCCASVPRMTVPTPLLATIWGAPVKMLLVEKKKSDLLVTGHG